MPVTTTDLEQAERAYRSAQAQAEQLREARNALVRDALAEGWTHQAIANATGLTRGRVNQLKNPVTLNLGP